jgi:methylenetetrahydrofolate--tRNA-(uracil-5-)-methyltransferase
LTRTIIEQFILDLSPKVAHTFRMTQKDGSSESSGSRRFVVIGAGLAGSEAALRLAEEGAHVVLYEQKPKKFSAVHRLPHAAELVCSNSFKSLDIHSAHGLLKEELRLLGSPVLKIALECQVPGGKALVVDREKLAEHVTKALQTHPLIEWKTEEIEDLSLFDCPILIATGPLTSDSLMNHIREKLGDQGLYFYDATSPVVTLESLDQNAFFWASRNEDGDDYLNLPLTEAEYDHFRDQVLAAEKVEAHHPDEKLKFFEGCLPIEELARRGRDTLAFSCMKPIGFEPHLHSLKPSNPHSERRPYAVIQFRREKAAGELLSMVGFQTRMKWPEQERVFKQLPGMSQAQFVRLGAMHRNSFINASLHLDDRLSLKRFSYPYGGTNHRIRGLYRGPRQRALRCPANAWLSPAS